MPTALADGRAYAALMLGAIVLSALFWYRRFQTSRELPMIYLGGLVGALAGAKVVYLLAEGWLHWGAPDQWRQWLTGKTVIGALFGGYAGVEGMKTLLSFRKTTGDDFASIVPIALIIGRIGCLTHGCCPGQPCEPAWYTLTDRWGVSRWPAVPLELLFNLATLALLIPLRRIPALRGQHFHLYLIAYGLFRFAHEFARGTPRIIGPFSGYHVAALALACFGAWRFAVRRSTQPLNVAEA